MIIGILDRDREGSQLKQDLLRVAGSTFPDRGGDKAAVWSDSNLAFCSIPLQIDTLDEVPQPFANEDRTVFLVFEGKIYNASELKKLLGTDHRFQTGCSSEVLVHLYEERRNRFLDQVNGKFAFALWDKSEQRLLLGRDRLGIEPLFYFSDDKRFIFGSSLRSLLATGWIKKQLNYGALLHYLQFCYNPGDETFVTNVFKLPAGHLLSLNDSGISIHKYWHLSFAEIQLKSEETYREEVLDLFEDAIRIRLDPHKPPGVFLSGGTDSSAIVSLTSRMPTNPIKTFSFRCGGKSFDESHYAQMVAQRYQTQHTVIPYDPDQLHKIFAIVESMDEPFCDIGIEIATWILGQAAHGKVSYVLSGEGGDELFAGHPVYVADKLAVVADRIPQAIMKPLTWILQRFPDNDQKKSFQVKAKRFAYNLSFPPELLSHRWRIYYTPQELKQLCTDDLLKHLDMNKRLDGMLKYNSDADGKDQLSRSLYSDYKTLVDFYLRRLGLLHILSVESRLPLMDYRLVEYGAKIPSWLKIRGLSNTKYVYKKILEEILPREILYGRPKLGHSIPMKNWLREDTRARELIQDVLSDGSSKNRGVFRINFVQQMIEQHMRKTQNHSHRLWGLLVLELWLRAWMDTNGQ
jgi:asparagine synthase (glutamine-hydrolysing)